jgi:hypothetical protein
MLNLYQLLVNADGFPACAFFSPHPIMNSETPNARSPAKLLPVPRARSKQEPPNMRALEVVNAGWQHTAHSADANVGRLSNRYSNRLTCVVIDEARRTFEEDISRCLVYIELAKRLQRVVAALF